MVSRLMVLERRASVYIYLLLLFLHFWKSFFGKMNVHQRAQLVTMYQAHWLTFRERTVREGCARKEADVEDAKRVADKERYQYVYSSSFYAFVLAPKWKEIIFFLRVPLCGWNCRSIAILPRCCEISITLKILREILSSLRVSACTASYATATSMK